MKYYILYNPLACSGKCRKYAQKIPLPEEAEKILYEVSKEESYGEILTRLDPEDKVVLCGGDGTLNYFVNSMAGQEITHELLYYPAGSGNDFLNDIGWDGKNPIPLNDYIKSLPVVIMGDKAHYFINGVGYGVDGYCCKEVNRLKSQSKKASYTLIALKGFLYAYRPTNAILNIDGLEYRYERVWLTPIMKGKFFGGGMKIAPTQERNDPEQSLTVIVAHRLSKLKILALFLTIFKGNHIKYKKYVAVHTGHTISVKFDVPTAMQIDGETVCGVQEYTVQAKSQGEIHPSIL